MNKNYLKFGILLTLASILFWGLRTINAQNPQTTTLKFNPKKYTLYTPVTQKITDTLILAGSVASDQVAVAKFQNSGKLVWVGVKVGDRVRRGQAIASLDKAELQKNLQTQFNNYRTQLSKFTDDQGTYLGTADRASLPDTIKRILDRTDYSLNNSVITYEIADMALQEATIYSPIDGLVVAVDQPLAGVNITPATATFTIINPKKLYFKAEIDQEAVTKVKVGDQVSLSLDSYPNQTIDSKITYIAFTPVAGESSTVYEIRFELPLSASLNPRIGMDGDANLTLAQADAALTIPTDAIVDDNGTTYVYFKKDNNLVRQNVQVGIENDTTTQIISGLSSHDQVAVAQK